MKKLSLAAIIVTVSISLAGCTNSETASNGNKTNTESTTQNSTESNVQNSSESSTENNNVNNISKIKYATAIKLAQDAVADIKKAGYNVSLEEIDTTNDYQIIIKLQK